MFYSNPVAVGGDFADPFVLRHNGRYYLYATNPDLRCWSSTDLLTWHLEGPTVGEDLFPGMVPFAPEVVYADGWFYLYTSPSGTGHRVLRSSSPTGPFEPVTGNLGRDIDGNVLIDDDGRWYFYWAGDDSILACEMISPTEMGPVVDTGVTMHGWTEGPFVMKRDGWYHMTLTGNHYLSPGYRINAAASRHPLTGWHDDPLNPVLVSTEPPGVGLGHSSSVLGPDLVSTYLVYHDLKPDRTRDLNLDRQVWNGRSLQILGPSRLGPAPAGPDHAGTPGPGWVVTGGVLYPGDGFARLVGTGAEARWPEASVTDAFTAEFNLRSVEGGGCYGLVLGHDDGTHRVRFDPARQEVAVVGPTGVVGVAPLPARHLHTALHCVRLVHDAGRLTVLVDGRRQLDAEVTLPPGAILGYYTAAGPLDLGHTALTHAVEHRRTRTSVKPVPGRFWAALTGSEVGRVDVPGPVPRERIVLRAGQTAAYELLVAEAGDHTVFLTGAFDRGARVTVRCGEEVTVLVAPADTAVLSWSTVLPAGPVTLRLEAGSRVALDLVTVAPAVVRAPETAEATLTGAAKIVLAGRGASDHRIEAHLDVKLTAAGGHGDLLLRAAHLADGFEGNDPVLGTNFLLGYSVQLHSDAVVLARHDYDEAVLDRRPVALDLSVPQQVTATTQGSRLTIRVGPVTLEHDDDLPHLVGGVGLRVLNANMTGKVSVSPV